MGDVCNNSRVGVMSVGHHPGSEPTHLLLNGVESQYIDLQPLPFVTQSRHHLRNDKASDPVVESPSSHNPLLQCGQSLRIRNRITNPDTLHRLLPAPGSDIHIDILPGGLFAAAVLVLLQVNGHMTGDTRDSSVTWVNIYPARAGNRRVTPSHPSQLDQTIVRHMTNYHNDLFRLRLMHRR